MTRAVAIVVAVLALMAASAFAGWSWRGERAQTAATDAAAQVATCVSGASAAEVANAALAGRIDAWRTEHDKRLAAAEAAIADRPAAVERIQTRARERTESLARARHEDPACAALATLPVCPAVARQLWPAREQAGGSDAPRHD